MTLPPSSYHAREVTFGCMAKGKGVSSRANLLISVKVLVGNTVSSGHHAKAVSSDWPLNKKKKKKKKKEIKEKNKGKNRLGKNCIHDRYSSPSTKAPIDNTMHPWLSLHPHV
jgi:tetrahydromethanopterin S-methyltransferase subunit H